MKESKGYYYFYRNKFALSWLFQGKKIALEKAIAKKLQEEESNREDVAGARERVQYLFKYRTNAKGQPFTFADLEAATASQNPVRQISVTWLDNLTEDRLVDLRGDLGRLFATSDFFGTPSGFNFWFGDFTEELKTEIRVINRFITSQWRKVYDTESVVLQDKGISTSLIENQVKLFREALDRFVGGADFKPTIASNLLLTLEGSYLILSLAPDETYNVLKEVDLMEEPFHFNSEKMDELQYASKEGWDFEWLSSAVASYPTINLSVSVPDGITFDQVKQGGPNFVQKLVEDQTNIDWLVEHLSKRLDHLLGIRTPNPSISAHRNEAVVHFCGRKSGVITVGDIRRVNKTEEDRDQDQALSYVDESTAELIKLIQEGLKAKRSSENKNK